MRRYFEETLAEFGRRIRDGGARKPARTLIELADEFGVTRHRLTCLIRIYGGPAPVMRQRTIAGGSVWYEYEAFRKWWRGLPPEAKP